MSVKFLQLNQQKSFNAAIELDRKLKLEEKYICLITEPYKVKCRVSARPSDSKVLVVRSTTPPRAAIYYRYPKDIIMIDSLSNPDCVVAILNAGEEKILLASVYMDITKEMDPEWLQNICKYAGDRRMPLLIGMDSNAHSVLFGSETNKRGELLEEFILQNGLQVKNCGDLPTFEAHRVNKEIATCVDVTMSRNLSGRVFDW